YASSVVQRAALYGIDRSNGRGNDTDVPCIRPRTIREAGAAAPAANAVPPGPLDAVPAAVHPPTRNAGASITPAAGQVNPSTRQRPQLPIDRRQEEDRACVRSNRLEHHQAPTAAPRLKVRVAEDSGCATDHGCAGSARRRAAPPPAQVPLGAD